MNRTFKYMICLKILALSPVFFPANAYAFTCEGNELVCTDLSTEAAITATGGVIAGGVFEGGGFRPTDTGGIDWHFGPDADLSAGRLRVEVTGLLPSDAGELEGGKVTVFSARGLVNGVLAPDMIQLQKQSKDYHFGSNIFRFGMSNRPPDDWNWDAVIITATAICGEHYDILSWQAHETHVFEARWSSEGLYLRIDDYVCQSPSPDGETFSIANKIFTLGARVQKHHNQHADAVFTNFQLWAEGSGCVPHCPDMECGMSDGCGGICWCPEGYDCDEQTGTCISDECHPDCTGRECGPDPVCGEICGACETGYRCSEEGLCEEIMCAIDCRDRECGPDPVCGVSCGECSGNQVCIDGICSEPICEADCTGLECGPDPDCGISCGECPGDQVCVGGICTGPVCEPDCTGLECGPDPVCGESCGTCIESECVEGICLHEDPDEDNGDEEPDANLEGVGCDCTNGSGNGDPLMAAGFILLIMVFRNIFYGLRSTGKEYSSQIKL